MRLQVLVPLARSRAPGACTTPRVAARGTAEMPRATRRRRSAVGIARKYRAGRPALGGEGNLSEEVRNPAPARRGAPPSEQVRGYPRPCSRRASKCGGTRGPLHGRMWPRAAATM